ncbi:MAG: SGNH/GDSL hydrolase family protein [Bacteroidetes bacterium]|nr:SGNH/GDSL hydrolase family protein [Bacteroidota bacterium]
MPRLHQKIICLLLGILLVLTTIYRLEWFAQFYFGAWFYMALVPCALVFTAGALGSFFGKKGVWAALGALVFLEMGVAVALRLTADGTQLPPGLTHLMRYVHIRHDRGNIVFHEQHGRWDERLFYTLRPGMFEYRSREFSTTFDVNSAGFRDDETALIAPEIIFLGDSYTMGWGVEQPETFAEVAGTQLQKRTLNAGVSSYGTARELLALEGLQFDGCPLVVLQFCLNDEAENRSFVENGFRLKVSKPEVFQREVRWGSVAEHWFPLKYSHALLTWAVQNVEELLVNIVASPGGEAVPEGGMSGQGVADFFSILQRVQARCGGQVVVFHTGVQETTPAIFQQFQAWMTEHPMEGIWLFPSHEHLTAKEYFTLDDHLNVEGHRLLGTALAAFILENRLLEADR